MLLRMYTNEQWIYEQKEKLLYPDMWEIINLLEAVSVLFPYKYDIFEALTLHHF